MGNDYVSPFLGIENVVDGLARILAVSYFGYHSAFLFGLGGVATGFLPQMRMIRILVPLAPLPYITVVSVTLSGIMVVMPETDSTVDFVESVELNTKKGKKKEDASHQVELPTTNFLFWQARLSVEIC